MITYVYGLTDMFCLYNLNITTKFIKNQYQSLSIFHFFLCMLKKNFKFTVTFLYLSKASTDYKSKWNFNNINSMYGKKSPFPAPNAWCICTTI